MSEELYSRAMDSSNDVLEHYGMPRRSGRYPWGSGENPFQHEKFYQSVEMLKNQGLSDKEIQKELNMNSSEYRAEYTVAVAEHKKALALRAKELAAATDDDGNRLYSNVEIGKMLGTGESTIRNYLKSDYVGNTTKIIQTMDALKQMVDDKNYIDVGPGSEYSLGCSWTRMKQACKILKETDGYTLEDVYIKQLGTGLTTTVKVLAPPGTQKEDLYDNKNYIHPPSGGVESYPIDANGGTKTRYKLEKPTSVDASRVMIKYAEDGGKNKDGVIELRRGCEDLTLGNSSYAQVRIMVNNSHYLKGMAVYSDNMPDGVDIIFNTNKTKDVPMLGKKDNSVLKPLKDDPDNPFGATINKQLNYIDSKGKEHLSPINIVNEEGSWGGENGWSKSISSQMLAKQNVPLIKRQLKLSYSDKVADYDEIMTVDNPTVRRKLLEAFAENCDTAAVHLKAAPFPRQTWNVILPVESLSANEIYAPQYKNGETLCLIRYPHGGTFEIPQLVVNNKNKEAKSVLGQAVDAVGINAAVAERLSGADFDGDTVLCIPANSSTSNVKIKVSEPLRGLEGFDPKTEYKYREGMKVMNKGQQTQMEMGIISNLITDMTLRGAPDEDIAAAVRHSMVVIDAAKHKLDYERSYEENHIQELKQRWQKKEDGTYGGASTLLSRSKSVQYVNERKEGVYITDPVTGNKKKQYIDPETGEKLYSYTGRTKKELLVDKTKPLTDSNGNYILDKKGKKQYEPILDENGKKQYYDTGKPVQDKSTQMMEAKDARELSSGLVVEEIYANYANQLKGLANEARKAYLATPTIKMNPEAKEKYKEEVKSLESKLMIALKNAPRERQAQILANVVYEEKKANNPNMTDEEKKKHKNQALAGARETVGAKKSIFNGGNGEKGLTITDREWEAIQSGAVSQTTLSKIVDNSDIDYLKRLSMPKTNSNSISSAKIAKIKNMVNSGFSIEEIARDLGVSSSTIAKYVKGGN